MFRACFVFVLYFCNSIAILQVYKQKNLPMFYIKNNTGGGTGKATKKPKGKKVAAKKTTTRKATGKKVVKKSTGRKKK